jgi:hypothetical protein
MWTPMCWKWGAVRRQQFDICAEQGFLRMESMEPRARSTWPGSAPSEKGLELEYFVGELCFTPVENGSPWMLSSTGGAITCNQLAGIYATLREVHRFLQPGGLIFFLWHRTSPIPP